MKIGVLNIPAPVRITPCPPRLQLQTFWMGVILTGSQNSVFGDTQKKVGHEFFAWNLSGTKILKIGPKLRELWP